MSRVVTAVVDRLAFLGEAGRGRELAVASLIVLATARISLTITSTYPIVATIMVAGLLLLLMMENQEKALYLCLWFSTVYLALKAVLLGWSDTAFLFKDGFLLLLFTFWLFHFVIREEKLTRTPISRPLAFLVMWLLVQCFNPNTYGLMSILQDLRFWLIPIFIFILTTQLVNSREKVERALFVVFCYATVAATYGVLQQFMPGDFLVMVGADPNSYFNFAYGTTRSFSTMGTAQLAIFAAMFPTICFFYMTQAQSLLHRWFYLAIAGVFFAAVVFTLVRTGWIAVTVTVLAYAVVSQRFKILVAMLLAVLLVFTVASGFMQAKLDGIVNYEEDASVQARLQIVRLVTEGIVFRAFGYGLGTFAHNRFGTGQTDRTGYGTSTENWYLMAALELGWVGVGILFWIWYNIYRFVLLSYRGGLKTRRYREMALAIGGSLFAIEVARLGGPSGYFPPDSWHYWFFVGLLFSLRQADAELAEIEGSEPAAVAPRPAAMTPSGAYARA